MFRPRAAEIAFLTASVLLMASCSSLPWAPSDNQEMRAAMAKAGQSCGSISKSTGYLPSFDCTSPANDGYVVVYESHQHLVDTFRQHCNDPGMDIDENDWLTSAGYYVRSGSAIIYTLRKHLDFDFYSAQSFCFEL